MKWIILAGWAWTRLYPLTKVTSKQLLPIYDKPMIYYPLETLIKSWIKDILIIIAPDNAGDFLRLLWSWKELWVKFTYEIQDKPCWIAEAFTIGENFIWSDQVALILWDNIFEDDFSKAVSNFESWAMIFAKNVQNPSRFWVVEFDEHFNVISIEEKPKYPKSQYAQTWFYLCDNTCTTKAKKLKPSARQEYEITDLINLYLIEGNLSCNIISGAWFDTGTIDSMLNASIFIKNKKDQVIKRFTSSIPFLAESQKAQVK